MTKAQEEKDALKDRAKLKQAAEENQKEALAKLKAHDDSAENGPDQAQRGQALPDYVDVPHPAEPTSKPQVTQKGKHAENG